MSKNTLLSEALAYARIGWPVFPLAAGTKNPAIQGSNGFKDATTDEEKIREWWTIYPNANIGFYPHKAGLSVLDIDVKNGGQGFAQLEGLQFKHGDLPQPIIQETPSKGQHWFYACKEPMPNTKIAPDIDVRCAGGYVVLAPSVVDGKEYVFQDGWHPSLFDSKEFPELPQWVSNIQKERVKASESATSGEVAKLAYNKPKDAEALIQRLHDVLEVSPKIAERWHGGTDGLNDKSGSAMDMSMAVFLKISGFTYSEMRYLLEGWEHGSKNPMRNDNRYWERIWQRSHSPTETTAQMLETLENEDYWREPVDVFKEGMPVPKFPIECMPTMVADYAVALSKQTGFDAGGYAFCAIIAASGHIHLSSRLAVTSEWKASANLWGGLSAASGGGKDPVMGVMMKPVECLDEERQRKSKRDLARWIKANKTAGRNGETPPPKPQWKQRLVRDTTVEALAKLLTDNDGVMVFLSEITEFIGRMDAYSGRGGAGSKDRGAWLRFRDGGSHTVNRRNTDVPLIIDNYGGAILAGIQPEKLAELMSKAGGGSSDGLFQRFLIYEMQEAEPADLLAEVSPSLANNYAALFEVIETWNESPFVKAEVKLAPEVVKAFNEYVNHVRTIAKRTPQGRFSEHISKFGGFLLNLTLTLHYLECAQLQVTRKQAAIADSLEGGANLASSCTSNTPALFVSIDTFNKALEIMRVLYRHSEAAYAFVDDTKPAVKVLLQGIAEAVISKGWDTVRMGDLTRHATGWRNAQYREKQEALDLLIEFDWLADITPPQQGRGRPSQGLFKVNPKVLDGRFTEHSERVKRERAERYAAIQHAAHSRARREVS